jgi:hypothetical protein
MAHVEQMTNNRGTSGHAETRKLAPAAERALREAAARRADIERNAAERPREIGGRGSPDPTRYGDWEKNGLASDF